MRISKHLFCIGGKQNILCRKKKKKNIISPFDYFVNTNFYIFKKKWLKFIMKNKSHNKLEHTARCYNNIVGHIEQNIEKEKGKVSNYILFEEKDKKKMMLKDNNHNNNNNNLRNYNFCFNHILIYNVILKNDIIDDIYLEVVFFDMDAFENIILNNCYGYMMRNYIQIFYKKLKCVHIKNKLINLYTSKVNNIYNNLLFYHTYKKKKNFLLHTSMYRQFSRTLKNMLKDKLGINVFTYQYIQNEKNYKKKTYIELIKHDNMFNVNMLNGNTFNDNILNNNILNNNNFSFNKNIMHMKQKYIHNYLFKIMNNMFINRFIYLYNKNKYNNINNININNINNIYNSYNVHNKHLYNSKIDTYKNIFLNYNLLKLKDIFFKFNHKNKAECKEILNMNYYLFIHTLINKRKEKKKYFLFFIKYYKELFNVNDIFIIDKENVKKNFFFFFYHSLIGGPSFFFFNKEKDKKNRLIRCNRTNKKKIKMKNKKKKKMLHILYNNPNYIPNISLLFEKGKNNKIINLKRRKRRKPYFINLNNNQLKYNSTDNYILFFLYDLIFNHNFNIYKYMNINNSQRNGKEHISNSFICTFKKNRNKKKSIKLNNILKDKIKDGRIILFTNDKKLQSMCFKINIFYQNVFHMLKYNDNYNNNKYDGVHNINKKLIKLYVFSDKILFNNHHITNNNTKNIKKVDKYELYSFSKSFIF
ncbi:probable protein, unknown function [Plasmodium gaboni]|uniref:Uncharacterized protein n=1 Tax=Plasmodium gaboni TaxID=647221 RepID=A0ABY1ULN9_9APIC|nr:probable protein, unknown function [Plasmodium gaboni]